MRVWAKPNVNLHKVHYLVVSPNACSGFTFITVFPAGRCVTIRGLRKEFDTPDGIKKAVDGVDLTMYEGQIFALLGHNGNNMSSSHAFLLYR